MVTHIPGPSPTKNGGMPPSYYGTVARHPQLGIGCQKPDGTWVCRMNADGAPSLKFLADFKSAFGGLFDHDIGKRIYRRDGVFQMESTQQRDRRLVR